MINSYDKRFDKLYDKFLDRDSQKEIKEIVFKFFIVFSRFEHALKCAGYLISEQEEDNAQPNWSKFAEQQAENFVNSFAKEDKTSRLNNAVKYLWDRPPRKEIVKKDKKLGLGKSSSKGHPFGQSPEEDIKDLVKLIKIVRNNLFHGEKFSDISSESADYKRDFDLLDSSLIILGTFLDLDSEVEKCFSKGM